MKKGPSPERTTIIGKGTVLTGSFRLEYDLWVHGVVEGSQVIAGGLLFVGSEGRVVAPRIEVGAARIAGRVEGLLTAREDVHLEAGAHFRGWLLTPHLFVADGATLEADQRYSPGVPA